MSDEDSPVTLNKFNMTTTSGKSLSLSMPDITTMFGERYKQQQQQNQQQQQQQQPSTAPKRKGALRGQVGGISCGGNENIFEWQL